MRIDESISLLKKYIDYDNPDVPDFYTMEEAIKVIIEALEQKPCDDCVSRQAVLEVIRKCHCEEWVKADIGAPIDALQSVTPQHKWILCKDRLPDKLKDVLIAFADAPDEYEIAYLKTTDNATYKINGAVNEWMTFAGASYADYEVDAWMPLPEPYKQEVEE